jgi:hypothetical protein
VADLPERLLTSYFTGAARQEKLSGADTKPIQAHALDNALGGVEPMTLKINR